MLFIAWKILELGLLGYKRGYTKKIMSIIIFGYKGFLKKKINKFDLSHSKYSITVIFLRIFMNSKNLNIS